MGKGNYLTFGLILAALGHADACIASLSLAQDFFYFIHGVEFSVGPSAIEARRVFVVGRPRAGSMASRSMKSRVGSARAGPPFSFQSSSVYNDENL